MPPDKWENDQDSDSNQCSMAHPCFCNVTLRVWRTQSMESICENVLVEVYVCSILYSTCYKMLCFIYQILAITVVILLGALAIKAVAISCYKA